MTVYSVNAVFRCENALLAQPEVYLEESIQNDENQYLLFEYYFSKSNIYCIRCIYKFEAAMYRSCPNQSDN